MDIKVLVTLKASMKDGVRWEISWHDEKDLKKIERFKRKMRISDSDVSLFAL